MCCRLFHHRPPRRACLPATGTLRSTGSQTCTSVAKCTTLLATSGRASSVCPVSRPPSTATVAQVCPSKAESPPFLNNPKLKSCKLFYNLNSYRKTSLGLRIVLRKYIRGAVFTSAGTTSGQRIIRVVVVVVLVVAFSTQLEKLNPFQVPRAGLPAARSLPPHCPHVQDQVRPDLRQLHPVESVEQSEHERLHGLRGQEDTPRRRGQGPAQARACRREAGRVVVR